MPKQNHSDYAFLMLKQWQQQIALLNDAQKAELLTAIYDFQCFGVDFETSDGKLEMLWVAIKQTFEYNNQLYKQRCIKNSENAKKRWTEA